MDQNERARARKLTVTHTGGAKRETPPLKEKDETKKTQSSRALRTTKSAFLCTCIICIAVLVRTIDTPVTNAISDGVRTALTFDVSVEDAIGRLKFVQSHMEDAATVFSAGSAAKQDVQQEEKSKEDDDIPFVENGRVAAAFEDGAHPYLEVIAPSGAAVVTPVLGTVSAVSEENESYSVTVAYLGGYSAVIKGLGKTDLAAGDAIEAGGTVGVVGEKGTPFVVYLYHDGAAVDPLSIVGH